MIRFAVRHCRLGLLEESGEEHGRSKWNPLKCNFGYKKTQHLKSVFRSDISKASLFPADWENASFIWINKHGRDGLLALDHFTVKLIPTNRLSGQGMWTLHWYWTRADCCEDWAKQTRRPSQIQHFQITALYQNLLELQAETKSSLLLEMSQDQVSSGNHRRLPGYIQQIINNFFVFSFQIMRKLMDPHDPLFLQDLLPDWVYSLQW